MNADPVPLAVDLRADALLLHWPDGTVALPATELRAAVQRLQDAGVRVVGKSDHTVTHSLYIEDPDGNEIELYIDVPGVDWKHDPEAIMAPIRPLAL